MFGERSVSTRPFLSGCCHGFQSWRSHTQRLHVGALEATREAAICSAIERNSIANSINAAQRGAEVFTFPPVLRLGTSAIDEGVVIVVMALLSFADSTPRA
jgi:hypothetical protein